MIIRKVKSKDYLAIKEVVIEAFEKSVHGYNKEADLIDAIRMDQSYDPDLELVAVQDGMIVGHGLLSEVSCLDSKIKGVALAPLSVWPTKQHQGIGSRLLQELENVAKEKKYAFIAILGDPNFYRHLGYRAAKEYGVVFPFEISTEYCLVKVIYPELSQEIKGTLGYLSAFDV